MKKITNHIKSKALSCLSAVLLASLSVMAVGCNDDKKDEPGSLTTTPTEDVKTETLRVLSYNILEGMKLDKANNYDNFVAWVKEINPDVFAIQEAVNLTQEDVEAMAARWGHQYAYRNNWGSTYPVAITSKYPMENVTYINDQPKTYHGGIFTKIKGVNFVVMHLYPFSAEYNGYENGDAYRNAETNYYLDKTIRAFPLETNWLMMGDFNSSSPLDNKYRPGVNLDTQVHETMLNSGYRDVMYETHNYFVTSIPTGYNATSNSYHNRIDFMYASAPMLRNLTYAKRPVDNFTDNYSDHYPIVAEFRIYPEL